MKRDLLFGMALLAGLAAQAASSPYAGSNAEEGTYYLYQVESGQWLQPNRTNISQWTTYSKLGDTGMDIQLIKPEGYEGYQIFCRFTGNGSLNGADEDRFFLDQNDRDITDWIFEPVAVDGLTNTFRIKAKATPEGTGDRSKIANDFFIGANDGQLSDNPTEYTWQLVSREERLKKMIEDSANGSVDATWLIPWNDLGRNDMRDRTWQLSVVDNYGGGQGHDGSLGYPVKEFWHRITMRHSYTLTDLPTGTYAFSVQAYYRDTEIESEDLAQRYLDGTEALRANYFAGSASAPVMSIFADAKGEEADGYHYFVEKAGKWVPNSMSDASVAMFGGAYVNEYIQAPVSDGTLTIGIEKTEADHRDWLIYKRFFLQYVGQELIAEDLTPLKDQLSGLIAEAEALPQTPNFIAAIENAKANLENAKSSSALLDAISSIQAAIDVIKNSRGDIQAYYDTKAITDGMGIDTSDATERFNNANSRGDYEGAIRSLRYARRVAVAEFQKDVFKGAEPQEGKFYLYNLGRGQWLCGGSDWGAHAALGLPGTELTLEDGGESGRTGLKKYLIETGLYNGDNHHLNYRGYMDAPSTDGFAFIPVEGKENVYYIVQGDYDDVHMAWNPYAGTDAGKNDETTVGTECRNLDPNDLNAQWKLVSRAEREALMDAASLENPVDMTFFMSSPNFNQREDISFWNMDAFNIWGRGDNRPNFVCESWNTDSADLNYMLEGLPTGVYKVSVQGYYRNGDHNFQVNNEALQNAILYAGNDTADDVELPNIMSESGNAPGEGDNATSEDGQLTINVPNNCDQAGNFFKAGLYKAYTVIEKTDDNDLPIGVMKEMKSADGDWVVVDNFRITYYGTETTKEAVKEAAGSAVETIEEAVVVPTDGRIYNLQGVEVKKATLPGIYVRNGKKFIIR